MPCRVAVFLPEPRDRRIPPQTLLPRTELERISDRRRRANPIFNAVLAGVTFWLGGDTSMTGLTRLAEHIAKVRGVPIDRLARRTKTSLICWLCENAPELALGCVPGYILPPKPNERPQFPRPVMALTPPPKRLTAPPVPSPAVDELFHFSDQEMSLEDVTAFWGE
jgi:hypothetical protein